MEWQTAVAVVAATTASVQLQSDQKAAVRLKHKNQKRFTHHPFPVFSRHQSMYPSNMCDFSRYPSTILDEP